LDSLLARISELEERIPASQETDIKKLKAKPKPKAGDMKSGKLSGKKKPNTKKGDK
jgi:uncharacterized small protein (DUF1192 family)